MESTQINWFLVAREGEGDQRHVEYKAYVAGTPAASIIWLRRFGSRPAGYMTRILGPRKLALGVFPSIDEARERVTRELNTLDEGFTGLFGAMAAYSAAHRATWAPAIQALSLGLAALAKAGAIAHEERRARSAAAIRGSRSRFVRFNRKHCCRYW